MGGLSKLAVVDMHVGTNGHTPLSSHHEMLEGSPIT